MAASNAEMVSGLRAQGFATPRVAEAMLKVDRLLFMPERFRQYAYADYPVPIGFGQTISAPGVVAIMSSELDVQPGMSVLEVGTGSGYQAAILAELAGSRGKVFSIERIPEARGLAKDNLAKSGHAGIRLFVGDGSMGLPGEAPFDRIIVTAASPAVPPALVAQLKDGGKLVIPVGSAYSQELVLVEKRGGDVSERRLLPVVFVPLIGEHGFVGEKA
ncbi:MAG: protein-L-isoaspartate(D-aspartate) O-methyltransferase [Candidatus ainarchaeum sp.]|nr:protein-L-isoaspartate(D-aspartate) O-methyltransferase [Candidatus ainarchaeum sp.]